MTALLQLLQPLRRHLAGVAVFSVLINLLLLAPALYLLQVFDRVLPSRHLQTLLLLTVVVGIALLAMAVLESLRSRLLAAAAATLERRLAPAALHAGLLRRHGLHELTPELNGSTAAVLADLAALRSWLGGPGVPALCDLPWLPLYLLVIALLHPLLALVAAVGAAALWAVALLQDRLALGPLRAAQAAQRQADGLAEQADGLADSVRALGMAAGLAQAWGARRAPALAAQARAARRAARFGAALKLLRQAVQVAMIGSGAWLVVELGATPGVLVAATVLLARALAPVEGAIAGWRGLHEARAAAARLHGLLQTLPAPTTTLPAAAGALVVDRVALAAPGTRRWLLQPLSLTLQPGMSLAVLGPTGAGKSLLARLLAGALQPTSGALRLDGSDLERCVGATLGYLAQDAALLAGSVRDNIARWNPQIDDAEVVAAAQRAMAHDFIVQLPQGYDTVLGAGGADPLSAGRRQRIALARALVGRPRLVVLDEPTNHLDADGEAALVQLVRQLKADGATLVVVTQRPSLVAAVDQVLLLRDGKVEALLPKDRFLAGVTRLARALPAGAEPQPAESAHG